MKPMMSALYALGFLGALALPGMAQAETAAKTATSAGTSQHPHIKHEPIKHQAIKHETLKHAAHKAGSTGGSSGQSASAGASAGDAGEIKAPKVGVKYGGP